MNVNEYGILCLFSVGLDLSANTALSIEFTKPDGSQLIVTNPDVTMGTVDVVTSFGLFPANQYLQYTFADGNVDQAGLWTARATYTDSSKYLISDPATFVVNP